MEGAKEFRFGVCYKSREIRMTYLGNKRAAQNGMQKKSV